MVCIWRDLFQSLVLGYRQSRLSNDYLKAWLECKSPTNRTRVRSSFGSLVDSLWTLHHH